MTVSDEDITEPHPARPSTLRVRRYRERRREGLRLLTLEMPDREYAFCSQGCMTTFAKALQMDGLAGRAYADCADGH
jgi:hypothetical protein